MGDSLGKTILPDFFKGDEDLTTLIFGIAIIAIAIAIPKIELLDEADEK